MARQKTAAQLTREIEDKLAGAKTARRQRDAIERPTPKRIFGRVDHFLSEAQDQLTHLVNAEVKASSPGAYRMGDAVFEKIERLRWELRDKMNLT